jgi:biofilm PGA synthesis N-glycosyltransferase PgaC
MIILYLAIFLFLIYSLLVVYYWLSWRSIPEFSPSPQLYSTKVSIIIPARNEEKNIGELLRAIEHQTYPRDLVEVVVINDHSTDDTALVVKKFSGVVLLDLKDELINSYKKKAIESGIAAASGELIITTDADCVPPPAWLETMISLYEERGAVFVAAPVAILADSTPLQIFQALDFLVLQGITGAVVFKKIHAMCNGANMAYEKNAFFSVNGFQGIMDIASGDDMLLMNKIWKKFPGRVHYLKSRFAVMRTQPMKSWKDFFQQRIRWASKARFYDDKRIFWVLLLVYLFNISFFALLIAAIWLPVLWLYLLFLWTAKTIVEFPLVYSVAKFLDQRSLLYYFFFFQPLHIGYTIAAGWLGQFGTYKWKGRTVK